MHHFRPRPSANGTTSRSRCSASEIIPLAQPALLRGAVRDWPAVRAGRESPAAMANYLRGFDNGAPSTRCIGDPAIGGHFFYNDDLSGHNFERRHAAACRVARMRCSRRCSMTRAARVVRRRDPDPGKPARLHAREFAAAARSCDRAARVARQPRDGADALRRLVQHRLRRGRQPPLHAVSARAAASISTSVRSSSRSPASRSAW